MSRVNAHVACRAKIQNLWRTYRALKGADPQDDDGPPALAGQYLYDPSSRKIDPAFCATFLLANSSLFPYASSKPVPVDSTSDDDEEEENESVSECATKEKPPVARRDEETDASTAPRALSLPSAEMYLYGLEWNMRMYLDFRYVGQLPFSAFLFVIFGLLTSRAGVPTTITSIPAGTHLLLARWSSGCSVWPGGMCAPANRPSRGCSNHRQPRRLHQTTGRLIPSHFCPTIFVWHSCRPGYTVTS